MKMKKILCTVLSASIIAASLAVPVFADYTAADYDIVELEQAEEKTGGESAEKVFTTTIDSTKEFYLTFDFKLSSGGLIEIPKLKGNGTDVDKVGPKLKISGEKLVTETNNQGGTNALGDCKAETWYRAEIEGRTGSGQENTTFRLYTAEGTLVQETNNFFMRNISSNSLSFNAMRVTNGSVKNVKLIQEKPDKINLSSEAAEIDAGSQMNFDYTMTRNDVAVTKYPVEYSVYNADNTALLGNDAVTITSSGVLQVAGTLAADTDVTVRASATFGDKTLVGTKAISLKAVDVSGEKFDTISISGDESVKAGTETTYTAAASKGGNPVTTDDGDVVWKVFDSAGVNELKWITVQNGVLYVPENTIPQNIVLRASGKSGVISANKTIAVDWADSDKETHHWQSTCDADLNGTETAVSVDGSRAYKVLETWKVRFGGKTGYTFTEFDIKFPVSGTGLNFCRNDGGSRSVDITSDGTSIEVYNGDVVTQVDADAWYHVEIAFSTAKDAVASCNVYKYDENGVLGNRITKLQIDRRNNGQHGGIDIFAGTIIDNIKVTEPIADTISLKAAHASMFPTEENQITATATKKGLPITADGIAWSVLDADGLPFLEGGPFTISADGLLKASGIAPEGTVTVQAKTATAIATVPIEIRSSEIFTMKNIGINEDGDKVVKLYVEKKLAYDDDVVFVMAFYKGGVLSEVRTLKGYGSSYSIGDNGIAVDWAIPAGFNKDTDEAKVFIWTSLN